MKANGVLILCLTYILGILLTGLPQTVAGLPVSLCIMTAVGTATAAIAPRYWRTGPKVRLWLIAVLVGCFATIYYGIRTPQVSSSDISNVQAQYADQLVVIQGKVLDDPRLTRNQKVRFDLKVEQLYIPQRQIPDTSNSQQKPSAQTTFTHPTGQLYTTVPLLMGTGLRPGQTVRVTGKLYEPQAAQNPGGFDFRAYLAQRGIFAGFSGEQVEIAEGRSPFVFGRLRQRIVGAFVTHLGSPDGALLSAMVLGRKAVDLPFKVRDAFNQAGLAHTIAASGFHVSLLLGAVLFFAQSGSAKSRLVVGVGVLLLYIGLTGAQPSIIRAGLMGFGALIGASLERKTRPVELLVAIATFMLIWNPLWIWDLGFQLSFLATLGLLVTTPTLMSWLDWLPKGIATLLAVPIAAYVWTVPLQLYTFGTVPTYSILLNAIATPLIVVLSLGGMASAAIALISPLLGSLAAWCLFPALWALMQLVHGVNQLPGGVLTVGTITSMQVIALYGLYGMIGWQRHRRRLWWLAGLGAIALVVIPAGVTQTQLIQVTVLNADNAPAIVVQNRGTTGLIYNGTDQDADYALLPFLRQQGIGRLNWAIAPSPPTFNSGWHRILKTVPIQTLYARSRPDDSSFSAWHNTSPIAFEPGQQLHLGPDQVQFLTSEPCVMRLVIADQTWLVLDLESRESLPPFWATQPQLTQWLQADVLWWSGSALDPELLHYISPQTAIAADVASNVESTWDTAHPLRALNTQIYRTSLDGALLWRPDQGFLQAQQLADVQP